MEISDPRRKLTPAQLECLRMVHIGSSKRIAQIRGGSPNTIDNHIKAALRQLDLASRDEAAELVRRWDAKDSQDMASQARKIVVTSIPTDADPAQQPGRLREEPDQFQPAPRPAVRYTQQGDRHHADTSLQRLSRIVVLTLAMVIILSAALPIAHGFEALARLVTSLRH